jgi:hypothetical protein
MPKLEPSQDVTDLRLKVFQFVERNQHGLEATQLTLFKLSQLIVAIACALLGIPLAHDISVGLADWGGWRWVVAVIAGLVAGIVGFLVGFFIFDFFERRLTRRLIRKVQNSPDADLWKSVDLGLWNFQYTLALLQLGARGQEVRRELPTVLDRMTADDRLLRRYGWETLRLVFYDEAETLGDYNPRASVEECRAKVTRLIRGLSVDDRAALLASFPERPPLSRWQIIRLTDAAQISAEKLVAHMYTQWEPPATPASASRPAAGEEEVPAD